MIVVPVAAVALGSAPAIAAIPFSVAAIAYFWCARSCVVALFPKDREAGLLGGEMLQLVIETEADLPQMQASAASYLDGFYKHNQVILEGATDKVREALISLGVEIVALAVALVVTILD